MNRKWRNINKLIENMSMDETFESVVLWNKLKRLTYAPNIGYTCWIFSYKRTLVVLSNHLGNGHWEFYSAATLLDLITAKLSVFKDVLACKKR